MYKAEKYYSRYKLGERWSLAEAAAEAKMYIDRKPVDFLGADIVQQDQFQKEGKTITMDFDDGSYIEIGWLPGEQASFSWGVIDKEN